MTRPAITVWLLLLTAWLLSGCGLGGSTVAEGGIGGSGISMGRVAQVGSVYVNGIQYNTDAAQFIVDGDSGKSLSDIAVGMVVRVTGSRDAATATGVAESVTYDSLLIGPVDTVFDASTSHLGVIGQAVHINPDTVFEDLVNSPPKLIGELTTGDLVEVSGFPSLPGEVLATRISLRASAGTYKVTGEVSSVDSSTLSFVIGALSIDASALPAALPSAGSLVSVTSAVPPAGTTLTAESISPVDTSAQAGDGEALSIEGVITQGLNVATDLFVVNGLTVDASLTSLSGDDASLMAGRIVEVDGVMNGTVLLAETIALEADSTQREEISSLVENVDLGARTVTLMGRTIHVTNSTIFESDHEGESTFSLTDLSAGDYLAAKVYDYNGEITATKLELEHQPLTYNARLEGYPTQLGGNLIEILGVTIDTTGIAGYTYEDKRIVVRGSYSGGILVASSITDPD